MNKKPYSSSMKKTPFKYAASKKIAKLILQGYDRNEVYKKCFDENYIEVDSLERRREITNLVYARLLELDDYLLTQFCEGDLDSSKFILAYAIAKYDTMFFEFLYEVYREALLGNKDSISLDDFDNFFEVKKESDLIVATWSSSTIDQLCKGYRNVLVESGLGERVKRSVKAIKPLVHPAIVKHIELCGDKEYLQAMLGV